MRWGALAIVAGTAAVVACGLNVSGTGGPSDAAEAGTSANTTADAGGSIAPPDGSIDLPDVSEPAPIADSGGAVPADGSDGATCTLPGYLCAKGADCCGGQCNALRACGACSSNRGTRCDRQSDCCVGLWCGRFQDDDPNEYQLCFPRGQSCTADVECCSGTCAHTFFGGTNDESGHCGG